MDSQDPATRRPIPTRVKIIIMFIMFALSAGAIRLAVFVGRGEGFSPKERSKTFGLGQGPAYIGGRNLLWEGTSLAFELYGKFRRYEELIKQATSQAEEGSGGRIDQTKEDYYSRWTSQNRCIGSCGDHAICREGVCVCDGKNEFVQLYGRCLSNSTAFLKQDSSDLKFRKPTPPAIPSECYTKVKRGDKTETILDPSQAHMKACQRVTYPDVFDHTNQTCEKSDHRKCLDLDTNMFCADSGLCQCRMDMAFNRETMECEILLNVDCRDQTGYDFVTDEDQETMEIVTSGKQVEDGAQLDEDKLKKAFCFYLEGQAEAYDGYYAGEYDLLIWGLNLPGFILLIFALLILSSTFCFCIAYIKDFLHFLDPRNAMAAITAQQEMNRMA